MNQRQEAAIRRLNVAMVGLRRVGLALAGVDDRLIVFDYNEFLTIAQGRGPAEVINSMYYVTTDAPYVDSGAT